ncbi:MAG: hypothetical protein NW215_09020 [Hyphomicrobiales bacterium]|nr:hypothetical protein [Hyphomicrobiales bacterium]
MTTQTLHPAAQDAPSCCAAKNAPKAEIAPQPAAARSEVKSAAPAPAQATPVFDRVAAYAARYQPVLVIAGASVLGGLAIASGGHGGFMHGAMGLFLFQLALLKLVDIGGFAQAFARYDMVAKAWRPYGYVYPFAELALALAYLSGAWPAATYAATVLIMGLGSIGVIRTLARGEQVKCACVGSKIDVPLGAVSVLENVGMAVMAAVMLAV